MFRITRNRTFLLARKLDVMGTLFNALDAGIRCCIFLRRCYLVLFSVDDFFNRNLFTLCLLALDCQFGNRTGDAGLCLLIRFLCLGIVNDDVTCGFIVQLRTVRRCNFGFFTADYTQQIITQLLAVYGCDRTGFRDGNRSGLFRDNDCHRVGDFRNTDRRTVSCAVA